MFGVFSLKVCVVADIVKVMCTVINLKVNSFRVGVAAVSVYDF